MTSNGSFRPPSLALLLRENKALTRDVVVKRDVPPYERYLLKLLFLLYT